MQSRCAVLVVLFLILIPADLSAQESDPEVAAARAVFERNLDAIRSRNREAYLKTYLESDNFAASTLEGLVTGFDRFAAQESSWPDTFDASDLELVRIAPGVVYGTYRYRVRYGTDEVSGLSQRVFVETDDGWKIAVTGAMASPPGTPPPPRAIVGATLIDGRGGAPVPAASVLIRDGKIECAGTAEQCPSGSGYEVTDGRGMWLTPGLADAHVHFSQSGWADARPDSLDVRARFPYEEVVADLKRNPERFARSYVCSGVTAVFDVGGYPWTLDLPTRFRDDSRAPHVVAAGPLLSTMDHWLNLASERQFVAPDSDEQVASAVRYLDAQGSSAVKLWFIVTPELPLDRGERLVAAAGKEAARAGLPLIVHATALAAAKASLRAGAKVLVHSVDDRAIDQEFLRLARTNETIVIPTLTVLDGYRAMYESAAADTPPAIDDPNRCVDARTLSRVAETASIELSTTAEQMAQRERYFESIASTIRSNLMAMVDAGIPVATGTDAGNPLTLHGPAIHAEMEAMQSAGMTPMQVITASTIHATKAMGIDEVTGSIVAGKAADMLLLAADPSLDVAAFRELRYVIRAGVMRTAAELSAAARE